MQYETRFGDGPGKQGCKVFIGGLSWDTTDHRLRAYFENYGVVKEAFVSYCRETGKPRGFGFVVFENPTVADRVVQHKHTIDRREVDAKHAMPRTEAATFKAAAGPLDDGNHAVRQRKFFVGGLPANVTANLLRHHFEQFGEVEDAVVMMDHHSKRSRGFGFITFAAEASAEAVLRLDSRAVICGKAVEVKPAVPRERIQSDAMLARQRSPGVYAPGLAAQALPYPYGALPPGAVYPQYGAQGVPQYYAPAERELQALHQQLGLDMVPPPPLDWPYVIDRGTLSDGGAAEEAAQWHDGSPSPLLRAAGVGGSPVLRPAQRVVAHGLVPPASAQLGGVVGAAQAAALAPTVGPGQVPLRPLQMPQQAPPPVDDVPVGERIAPFDLAALSGALPMQGPPNEW